MLINREQFEKMMREVASEWDKNFQTLCDIDSKFGDGDHGVTIRKMSKLIGERLDTWTDDDIGKFLCDLGMGIMEIGGGSAGPLYGTMVEGLGIPAMGREEIDGELLKQMYASCLSEMEEITTAKCGEKTMMDALIPAVESIGDIDGGVLELLKISSDAAEAGMEASKDMVSKFGRARSYGDQTIGTPDAGATSTYLFFKALYDGAKDTEN